MTSLKPEPWRSAGSSKAENKRNRQRPGVANQEGAKAVSMPIKTVYEALFKAKMLDEEQEKKESEDGEGQYCQYHQKHMGHSIEDCQDFLDLVQELMDEGRIEFCKEVKGQAVNVL